MRLIDFFIPLFFVSAIANAATNYSTPNMGLIIPIPGQETGPAWAEDINASLTLLDSHDHTSGKGLPITPLGMNITTDLSFNGFFLTSLGANVFSTQSFDPTQNASIYSKGVDLYYKDGNGNVIQITSSGGVAGTPGAIANLVSPASASYVSADGTFVWQQGVGIAANMDAASLIIRYPGSYPAPAGNFIALEAPASLATGYQFTLPNNVPTSNQSALVSDTAGTLSYMNPNAIAAARTRTVGTSVAIGGVAQSASSGLQNVSTVSYVFINNLAIGISTSGRPVAIDIVPDQSSQNGLIQTSGGVLNIQIIRDSTLIYQTELGNPGGFDILELPLSLHMVDFPPAGGPYTYFAQIKGNGTFQYGMLVVYEL